MSRRKTANLKWVQLVEETITTALTLFYMVILLILSVLFSKLILKTIYNRKRLHFLLSKRKNIPTFRFEVLSRVIDKNWYYRILSALLMRKHVGHWLNIISFCNFKSFFQQGERLELLLDVYPLLVYGDLKQNWDIS